MKINLENIKASPKPIRTTWDETKMDELKWSLMEEGQVEPIGVIAVNESARRIATTEDIDEQAVVEQTHGEPAFEIVWGHRRVEAARRAAWKEIEAVIVPKDEVDNLIQAGIENLASEDMSAEDKANWAYRLTELGLSDSEISRRSSINRRTIGMWLDYRREKTAGVGVDSSFGGDEGVLKTVEIARALGNDLESKKAVATKVSEDRLTRDQTRAVAEAYRDAPTPAVKAQVLKTPIVSKDTSADILRRSVNRVEMETGVKLQSDRNEWDKERDEKKMMQAWKTPVKDFLSAEKLFEEALHKNAAGIKNGVYSPEAAAFTARKIRKLIDLLKTAAEMLEEMK